MATASSNEFKLIGPQGEERYPCSSLSTLSCHLSPEVSAVDMEIRWFKGTDCVCLYKDRQVTEGSGYEDRVSLFTHELERGNVSLQLRDWNWTGRGDYLCQVSNGDRTEELTVAVTLVIVRQKDRKRTEEERMKMKNSILMTELTEKNRQLEQKKQLLIVKDTQLNKTASERDAAVKEKQKVTEQLQEKSNQLVEMTKEHKEKERLLTKRDAQLLEREQQINEKDTLLFENVQMLQLKDKDLNVKETFLKEVKGKLRETTKKLAESQRELEEKNTQLEHVSKCLCEKEKVWESCKKQLETQRNELQDKSRQLQETMILLEQQKSELTEKDKELEEKEKLLTKRSTQLMERKKQVEEKEKLLTENAHTLQMKLKMLEEKEKMVIIEKAEFGQTLHKKDKELRHKDTVLREVKDKLEESKKVAESERELVERNTQLMNVSKLLSEKERLIEETEKDLLDKSSQLQKMMILLGERERLLSERVAQLMERHKQVEEKDRLLWERTRQLQESTGKDASVRRRKGMAEPPKISEETPAAPLRRRDSMERLLPNMTGEPSGPNSSSSVCVPELRLVLLGRTGSGKSAVGNMILSTEEMSQTDTPTVRQQSESRQGEMAGRQVTVVDTPDWFCPRLSLEELRQDVGRCVRLSAPGPNAFLLVLPVKQSTGEDRGMLEKMEEIFGERCWRNTIIIFTVTGEVQEKEFIRSGTQEFQRLVEKCENRFHILNIKESRDGSQVSDLLEQLDDMLTRNREEMYSSEIYLETESQIREMEKQIVTEVEKMKTREEKEAREKLKRNVQDSLTKFAELTAGLYKKIGEHEARISELERLLEKERDKNRKKELERELERVSQEKEEMGLKLERLKVERENKKSEMEERHRQEMEEITEKYERIETERNVMKIILPELHHRFCTEMTRKQKDFDCRLDEKERELERLRKGVRRVLTAARELGLE